MVLFHYYNYISIDILYLMKHCHLALLSLFKQGLIYLFKDNCDAQIILKPFGIKSNIRPLVGSFLAWLFSSLWVTLSCFLLSIPPFLSPSLPLPSLPLQLFLSPLSPIPSSLDILSYISQCLYTDFTVPASPGNFCCC